MDLVEDDQIHVRQLRIALQAAGQHPLGDHLDARVPADAALVAGLIADEAADLVAEQVCHPVRRGASREAPGLQHDQAVSEPRFVHEVQRHDGGLSRAGRRDQNGRAVPGERCGDIADDLGDRQARPRRIRRVQASP